MTCRTLAAFAFIVCGLIFAFAIPLAAQTATVTALTGQSCAGTRFGSTLNCTSNDFSSNLTFDQPSQSAIASCIAGETVTIDVLAAITSNSPLRYDGGYFIGENGIDPRLNTTTSSCSLGVFPTTPIPFLNQDSDSCGDFQASSTATLLIDNVSIKCQPVPGTNNLAIPYVLVFNNQAGSTSCTPANLTANTTAKCLSSTTSSVTGVSVNG
jgi:trimeric autotransporter adhesin